MEQGIIVLKSKPVLEIQEFFRYNYRVWQSLRDVSCLSINADHENSCNGDVYILYTGSSIKGKDLSWLSGKNVIATNMFFMNEYYPSLDIQHYLLIEPWQYRKQWHLSWILDMIMTRAKVDSPSTIWLHGSAKPYIDYDALHFCDVDTRKLLNKNSFRYINGKGSFYREKVVRDDFSKIINTNVNTMTFTLFFAAFLGYKNIYLLGSDYTKTPKVAGHFYDNVSEEAYGFDESTVFKEENCIFADNLINETLVHLDKLGVGVFNAVDDGYISRDIKSINYTSLISKDE
ncbi:MAG: hypothetical protein HOE45_09645 [Gammaproteobacteria bacterium]|nr:hypothetical protein [Gammaproteobacteria bacterium]